MTYLDLLRVEPVDVSYLRGNRLFAESGDAEPVMPPWPSLFAGAIRSRMLAEVEGAIDSFAYRRRLDGPLSEVVGRSPTELGSFRIAFVCLERGAGERLYPLPADVVVQRDGSALRARRLQPMLLSETGLAGSFPLPYAPLLRTGDQEKPVGGLWTTEAGMRAWLAGEAPSQEHLVRARDLWADDPRLGIALDAGTRTARAGMLYTTRTVALRPGVRFLVGVAGARGQLPDAALVRLGGDGRAGSVSAATADDSSLPWRSTPSSDRFTMLAVTPGVFASGWLPPGTAREGDEWIWRREGLTARIEAAALGGHEVVSGWDVAAGAPKKAVRVVPAGSVYYLRRLQGDLSVLDEVLAEGLWPEGDRGPRRAEGFNNVWLGAWGEATSPAEE